MAADIKKRRKITTDLDNTASPSQILDELPHKNKEAFIFYCRNLLQMKTIGYHCYLPGYPLNTFSDDWKGQLLPDYFQPFIYRSLAPKMITNIQHKDKTDPITALLYLKKKWNESMATAKRIASRQKDEDKVECLNEKVIRCPKSIISIAHLMDKDPDKYFNCRYNWYYSGLGNLHVMCFEGDDYLLTSEFCTVYLRKFMKKTVQVESDPIASFSCGLNNNILEIDFTSEHFLAFRTRNKIFISKLTIENDQIQIKKITTVDSQIPFTGISFDNYHSKVLNITLLDKHLYIINLETLLGKKILLKGKCSSLTDNWNRVIGGCKGYYLHVSKQAICVYDKKTNQLVNANTIVRRTVDEYKCSDITVARQFGVGDYAYFGTAHHLFELDLRFFKSFKLESTSRWTHGMRFPPLYLDACGLDAERELVCLAGPRAEDMCVVPNRRKSGFAFEQDGGVSVPYRPPSVLGVLREARERQLCGDTRHPPDARLAACVAGLALLDRGSSAGANVLLHNSLGDISRHALLPAHLSHYDADDAALSLHEWCKQYHFDRKPLEVSEIVNVAKFWKRLRRVPDDVPLLGDVEDCRFDEKEVEECFELQQVDLELREAWGVRGAPDAHSPHYSDTND